MTLQALIKHFFGGSRAAFVRAVGYSAKTVCWWLKQDAVVWQKRIHLPVNEVAEVPQIPAHTCREDFKAMMSSINEETDLTRVGQHYVDGDAQKMWKGWMMAQQLHVEEPLPHVEGR